MQTVKLLKALDIYLEGQTISVDEDSAAALIERGDAEPVVDEPADATVDGDDAPATEAPASGEPSADATADADHPPAADAPADVPPADPVKPGRPKASTRG